MHGSINVKSPNNTSKWQMGFNSAFKRLISIQISSCKVKYYIKNFCVTQSHTGIVQTLAWTFYN
jgi:hypothetical protein